MEEMVRALYDLRGTDERPIVIGGVSDRVRKMSVQATSSHTNTTKSMGKINMVKSLEEVHLK